MEQWEAVIENLDPPPHRCHRSFEKILETAAALLNTAGSQLAPFEIEWLVETLLFTPVCVLDIVSSMRGDEAWRKAIADGLKLLLLVAGISQKHHENIVDTCLLGYDPELRKYALACLATVAKQSSAAAKDVARHVRALEEGGQCRAPIALLVGALCEHQPAIVCDYVTRIWRGFLNMLDNNKITDTVTKAALEGVCSLLKHFGDELPCAELNQFYDNMTKVYINRTGCQSVCYKILAGHGSLFRERISADRRLRSEMWGAAPEDTVLSVYAVTAQCVDTTALVKILTTEVFPHTQSPSYQIKLTALRVLASTKTGSFGDLTQFVDIHTLEYELRRKVMNSDAELILWCVEYSLPNSERLLQAAILFYDNLPPALRKKIIVKGILNSPPELKRAAIQFLISTSCEDLEARVWRELLEDDAGAAAVVEELADCLQSALEAVSEEVEELPLKLSALLRLASLVPPARAVPLRVCGVQLPRLARHAAALNAAEVLAAGDDGEFYKSVRLRSCRDEATLHAACLALVRSPDDVPVAADDLLCALQLIFSSDAEPKIHEVALRKFEWLLNTQKCLDFDVSDTLRSVEKLRTRGDRTDRDVRVLHREVALFLGKHGNIDINNNRDSWDDTVVVGLKKSLALTVPYQGTSYKIDLKTMLQLAFQHEDPGALQALLAMLCANLSSNNALNTQRAITRVSLALANAHAAGGGEYSALIQQAVRLCGDAGVELLQYISNSKSCGARKLLAAALASFCEEPDNLVRIAERARGMLTSGQASTKRAGLDIAETILELLENNHSLSKTILPELTILIAKTYENDTKAILDIACKGFIDKKQLFDKETVRKTILTLLENLLKTNISDVEIYKDVVKVTLVFIKNLRDVRIDELLEAIFDICKTDVNVKTLYVLAVLKSEFCFDNDTARKILGRENCVLLNYLLNLDFVSIGQAFFEVEVALAFLEEYWEGLLELKYTETVQFTSTLIKNFTPIIVKQLQKSIKKCFSSLNKHCKSLPRTIISSIKSWLNELPIKKITEAIERELFTTEHHLSIEALKVMSNVFDIGEIMLPDVNTYTSKWPLILMKLHSSGRLEEYFSDEITYFNDMLIVSLRFSSPDDVKKILKSNIEMPYKRNVGVPFCGYFIQGFFEVLTEKPFILLDDELNECSVVLNDIVRLAVKKTCLKERCENVLELVDKLWPTYEQHTTFVQKHCLLTNLQCLGPGPDSNPLQWATAVVWADSSDASLDERIKLLCFVPEDTFKLPEVMSSVSSLFPARLRELRPALLEAVAARPAALLPAVAALAANDSSTGWWDTALESCVAAAAKRNTLDSCGTLFQKCLNERACERVLVPLLRHSSTELCEQFLATILEGILGCLKKGPKAHGGSVRAGYQSCMEKHMISLHMLLIAFEKLPTSSLESPSSVLYSVTADAAPWHVVREVCRRCHLLRDSLKWPENEQLQEMYRKLQCLIYNTMCAGICRRRPTASLYEQLLSTSVLEKIAVGVENYVLPIRASWMQRTKLQPVAVPLERSASASTLSPSHTQRSRIFLRTLSEDPMLFDLHSKQEEVTEVQDLSLIETPLNAHACAGTLTALLKHAAPTLATLWPVASKVLIDASTGVKWLLAQVICNCKEELKPHASILLPGLLAVLASVENGKSMNGLHIDVLDTILYWKEDITSDDLNTIAHHLITTCMENRKKSVFDGLVKTLQGFLELYGTVQIEWKSFEAYYEDKNQDTQKAVFKLIKTISKAKVYVPQILHKILSKLDSNPATLAESFGLALAACRDGSEKGPALGEFRKYLEKCNVITTYIRVLHYASLSSVECCGEQEFRKIADYVTKVTSADRTKCLNILSAHLSRGRRTEHVADMFDTIDLSHMIDKDHTALLLVKNGLSLMNDALRRRCISQVAALRPTTAKVKKQAVDVMRTAYEELFATPPQPPAKRQKTESTPILSVSRDDTYSNSILTSLGAYATDDDEAVAKEAKDVLAAKLAKNLGTRFAECFLLALYLPAHTDKPPRVCVCVCALLEMLFSDVRGGEGFKELRLRDEPLPVREEPNSKLLTLSKTFQGTFGSYNASRRRTRTKGGSSTISGSGTGITAIDVQMPIDSILQTLLEFAKTTPDAARSLLAEVLRSILTSTKFDVAGVLVPLLGALLGRGPTDLTPVYIDVCRALAVSEGLLGPVESLRALTAGTEGAALTQLLYEEVAMRCLGESLFQLGHSAPIPDVIMDESSPFSIEDLKRAFGKLSDWDSLTLQQRREVKNTLPPLWTDRNDFVARLDSYNNDACQAYMALIKHYVGTVFPQPTKDMPQVAESWFDKMAAASKQQTTESWRWLRKADRWPRKNFEISAIIEAMSWMQDPSDTTLPKFKSSDCLAECAARLMVRSSYYNSRTSETYDGLSKLSRSHELSWCMRANEMGLPKATLQCIERNVEELGGDETLAWLRQKLLALRQMALERPDFGLLRDCLKKAEKYTPGFASDPSTCIEMQHLMLLLHNDLKSLSHSELQSILAAVDQSAQQVDWKTCSKEAVSSVFQIALAHYDEALESGTTAEESALTNMAAVLGRAMALNAPKADLLLAVFLNRLNGFRGQMEGTTKDFLEKLAPLISSLDTFTLELLEENAYKFPAELHRTLAAILPKDASVEKYRKCLQLVCDPGHLLTHYCEELVKALRDKDAARWKSILDKMREKVYENPYAGPSYKLLDKYKEDLYGMYEFEPTPDFASRAEAKLKTTVWSLRREPQSTLRLADLCPTLLGSLEDTGVEKWFGLRGVKIVKFYDKVQVFTDSIRRPVVLSMLLTCGRTHRAVQKTGERLASDAAAQRVAAATQRHGNNAYNVTLLDEESALIEFLEGHERLRSLIGSTCNLDVSLSGRPRDELLVESPTASLQAHAQLCAKIPAWSLRSALEQNSSCVKDFISKKHNFTDSLADMTLLIWLLGLGDRHLQNIMCSSQGVIRSVDWGDVWHRAAAPPARLTRNILAVADTQVLESRLQSSLSAMRSSAPLLEAGVRVAFHWMGPELHAQMGHVRGILRGVTSSFDLCRDVTRRGDLIVKDKYVELLERTLGDTCRNTYSVEEQVSCLLRHCTSPALLSVVRAGWEPWL